MGARLRVVGTETKGAHIVTIGSNQYFFSYGEVIGFEGRGPEGPVAIAIENKHGPTTRHHYRAMGCDKFTSVPDVELERIVNWSVRHTNEREESRHG